MEAKDYVARLLAISEKKESLLELMKSAFVQERVLLMTGGKDAIDALDGVLNEKQRLMEEIDKLDEQFHVYSARLKQVVGIDSLEQLSNIQIQGRLELKGVVTRINELLKQLDQMQQDDLGLLGSELGSTQKQMKQLNQNKTQARAFGKAYYPSTPAPPSIYFDKKK